VTTPDAGETVAFGPLLRRHRLAAGLTQEALAERTGLGTRSIQHLEGGTHLPHRDTLARLVGALGLGGAERSRFARAARPGPRRRAAPPVASGDPTGVPDAPTGDGAHRPAPHHNLPAPLTPFVGRAAELAEMRELLGAARLVTVTGAGWSGKTRLAQRVAAELVGAYPDGVWFVDLAPLADPALVPPAVASALGVVEQPGQPLVTTLRRVLRDQCLLLLLDNCEHLVEACAHLTEAMLTGCPAVRILATSREALGIAGEVSWGLPPLPVPPPDWEPAPDADPAALLEFAAVALFVERARAADPAFAVTRANAPAVVQICRRVDGLPLALELAAARVRVFSVERIAGRLDDLFGLLTGGSRTALLRHRTLGALIDWSHDLLSEPERRLFRRLSVFAGGCSYEAIEGVCTGEGVEAPDVPDLLTGLVERSLVVAERGEPERYRLLETLRQYGRERVVQAGEVVGLRDRHRDWFLLFAERAKPELFGPRQAAWLDRLETEHGNLRGVWERVVERGPAELGLRLAGALWPFFFVRGHLVEGQEWLARALAAPGALAPTAARAEVLAGACELTIRRGEGVAVPRLAGESLAIRRSLGDRPGAANALRLLALQAVSAGDQDRAEALGAEALALARDARASWVVAQALEALGGAAHHRGDHPLARRRMEESLALFRELDDRRAIASSLLHLGRQTCGQGDHAAARAYLQESVTIARELRSEAWVGRALSILGVVARLEGDHARSWALLEEGLALVRKSGDRSATGSTLVWIGSLARAEGDVGRAETLVKEGLALFLDLGDEAEAAAAVGVCGALAIQRGSHRRGARLLGAVKPQDLRRPLLFRDDRGAHEESRAAARAALGERDFAAATAQGAAMTPEQAIASALEGDGG
jgi:predicted ATPase/DNA-binding XRE family transcriptional regulator